MKTAIFFVAIVFCLPLWAEDQLLDRDVSAGFEYQSDGTLIGSFSDQILHMDYWYSLDEMATKQIMMTLPILSPGIESLNDKFLAGLTFWPPIWKSETDRKLGRTPIRLDQYFTTVQYLVGKADVRFSIPVIYDGRRYAQPMIDLKYLQLYEVNRNIKIVARGFYDFSRLDFDLGVSFKWRSIKASLYSDLEWSVGYSTVIN